MTIDFMPLNDLERRLVAAQKGQIPPGAFAEILASSRVFMPIHEDRPADTQPTGTHEVSQPAQPLKIPGEDGGEVLVLFTSPERAKEFVADYPGTMPVW